MRATEQAIQNGSRTNGAGVVCSGKEVNYV
jgi:hypothetical protein